MNQDILDEAFNNKFSSDSFGYFIKNLLQNSINGIFAYDNGYNFLFFNSYMEQLTGKNSEEVVGKNIFELFPNLGGLGLKEICDKTFRGETSRFRNVFKTREEKDFHYEALHYPMFGKDNEILGGIAQFQDITHLVQLEVALQNSYTELKEKEERLNETAKFAKIGNWERNILTGETNWEEYLCQEIYEVSDSFEKTFDGLLGLVHPEDKMVIQERISRIIEDNNEDRNNEFRIYTPSGKLKYISSYTRPIYDETGKAIKVRGYSQDITRLKESELLLKAIVDNCFHRIAYVKPVMNGDEIIDFEVIIGNQPTGDPSNPQNSDIKGKWIIRDYYFNDKSTGMFQTYVEIYKSGGTFKKNHFYSKFNKWYSVQVLKMMDGLLINFADITESKNMEGQLMELNRELEEKVKLRTEDLMKEKEQFRFLADAIPQLVFISTPTTSEYVNQQWARFHNPDKGQSTAEWWNLLHPEDLESTSKIWAEANEKGTEFNTEYRMRRDDGQYIWFMVRAIPIKDESGKVVKWFGTCTDIHKIKEAERSLKVHSTILTNMAEGICAADKNGIITYTNPAFDKIFGYERGELTGKHVFVLTEEYTGSIEELEGTMKSIVEKGEWIGEVRNIKKDGTPFFTYAHINSILIQGELHMVSVQTDITEIKKNQKLLQESSERLNKLNTELNQKNIQLIKINQDLDNFVYTASHDLKAPVSNIEALMYVLEEELNDESKEKVEVEKALSLIQESIQRFKTTINDLTDISKVVKNAEEEVETVNINDLVEDICSMSIRNLIDKHKPEISKEYEVENLQFSRKNLRSIFYNLISNGIKYRAEERPPVIKILTQKISPEEVMVSVSDNGLGINPSERHKLFSMYKRLHHHVDGSGVGLYIVKKIVDNAGGRVEVESEVGKGTTFKVYFRIQENQ